MSDDPYIVDLRCPTCGEAFHDKVAWDGPDPDYDYTLTASLSPRALIVNTRRPYLTCLVGHKWTIKQVTYGRNQEEDRALLGHYIGNGP